MDGTDSLDSHDSSILSYASLIRQCLDLDSYSGGSSWRNRTPPGVGQDKVLLAEYCRCLSAGREILFDFSHRLQDCLWIKFMLFFKAKRIVMIHIYLAVELLILGNCWLRVKWTLIDVCFTWYNPEFQRLSI